MVVVALACAAVGCASPSRSCGAGDRRVECAGVRPATRLVVTPEWLEVAVDLGTPAPQAPCLRALAYFGDENAWDVTHVAAWSSDLPELGQVSGGCLGLASPLPFGASVQVRAEHAGTAAVGTVEVRLQVVAASAGVGPEHFRGPPSPDPARRPAVAYPLGDSMHPRNLARMTIHFSSGGNAAFRATITGSHLDSTSYFKPTLCESERCRWEVPEELWRMVARSAAGGTTTLLVAGTAGTDGALVAESDPVTLAFSVEDVRGGLYFSSCCTAMGGQGEIWHVPFTDRGTPDRGTPLVIPMSSSNPGLCAGCHTVSRDGSKIAATYGRADDFLGIASASDPTSFSMRPGEVRSNFQSFNPDGSRLITNFDGALILRDGTTGREIARVLADTIGPPGFQRAVMPDWSPAGDHIVFVRLRPESRLFNEFGPSRNPGGDWAVKDGGDIAVIPFKDDTFGPAQVLAHAEPMREYHFYPTWSPDGEWVLFNSSEYPGASILQDCSGFHCNSPSSLFTYAQTKARLRLVRANGSPGIELERATVRVGVGPVWATFAPAVQRDGIAFITFSSRMEYGHVKRAGRDGLWMAAIDLARAVPGGPDPSFAPLWLSFQDPFVSSHRPVWAAR